MSVLPGLIAILAGTGSGHSSCYGGPLASMPVHQRCAAVGIQAE
jgi:hypothetical protein